MLGEVLLVDGVGDVGELTPVATGVTEVWLVVVDPVRGNVSMSAGSPWLEQAKPKVARDTEKTRFRMKESSG